MSRDAGGGLAHGEVYTRGHPAREAKAIGRASATRVAATPISGNYASSCSRLMESCNNCCLLG